MKKRITACLVFLAAWSWSLCWAQVEFPKALKEVVPLYPKAKVVTALETADASQAVLEASGKAKEVVSFYKTALEGKGWKMEVEMHQQDNSMANFKRGKQVLSIVADSSDKAKTNVVFTLGKE